MIQFGHDICTDPKAACNREWLETNGIGGFASSTIIGLNTRRYHGLLTAATKPPVGRVLLLSKLEETLVLNGQHFELSVNQYPGVIHPKGYQYLKGFRLDPFPIFTYEVGEVQIERSIFMIHGENSTVVAYAVKEPPKGSVMLEVRPLIAFRDYHSTTHENAALDATLHTEPGTVAVAPYPGLPMLHLAHDADILLPQKDWYRSFEYAVERERGLDWVEDLFHPYTLQFDLSHRSSVAVIASTERRDIRRVAAYRQAEVCRRAALEMTTPADSPVVRLLVAAADQFIVSRGEQHTVIAGYHWFGDWGRDTMIALPGLTLTTGRTDVARSILSEFSRYVDRGMLPNRFPDAGEPPDYNTVDATLWFFEAVRAFMHAGGEEKFVQNTLYPALNDIIGWHRRGTRYGIQVDDDGLLAAGEEGMQLTWMDARVNDREVTPRRGKPVEVQALWYNALCSMEALACRFGDQAHQQQYHKMAAQAQSSFTRQFWNDATGCLYDVVNGDQRDAAIRPNQIFAVSLPYSMLSPGQAKRIIDVVAHELLTPHGLRSLSPNDPQYRGRCDGDSSSRDGAYHQGTVWAWLMGPFITAYVKVHGGSAAARQQASTWIDGMCAHLHDVGLGQVSEIFDGDAPHQPRGCIAQAWSVAEWLRATVEDVLGRQPTAAP
jgi:predicted glycogen debranching enzyme